SGETSVGQYPVEAVATMDRIARETETHLVDDGGWDVTLPRSGGDDHITHATCAPARGGEADVNVGPTYSGRPPRRLGPQRAPAADAGPASAARRHRGARPLRGGGSAAGVDLGVAAGAFAGELESGGRPSGSGRPRRVRPQGREGGRSSRPAGGPSGGKRRTVP